MAGENKSRADLHIHSKYSDRPSEWFLRRIGAPESFVEPMDIYRSCIERGMDFVTISDHNCIRGALEIAHLPGTFLSSEITTYFPENGCKIHCLVSGISEKRFADIQQLRGNIYELQAYLAEHDVIHSIAHPLFRINDRLTIDQFEKLILLFKRFETINGARHPRACVIARAVFDSLTPEIMDKLADKHDIRPTGPEPWKKYGTGGSDDHGGLYPAGAHTLTPYAATVFDFLEYLREGRHEPAGQGGSSIMLANSLHRIAYNYYKSRFLKNAERDTSLIGAMLKKFASEKMPAPADSGFRAAVKKRVRKWVARRRKKKLSDVERLIVDEFTAILERERAEGPAAEPVAEDPKANFRVASRLSQQLTYAFAGKFIKEIQKGRLIESLQSLSSLGPVMLGIAPYFTAFSTQHKDEKFLRSVTVHFRGVETLERKTGGRAWVTDTFDDVNGVAHTIHTLAGLAHEKGMPMTVITGLETAPKSGYPLKNFPPVGTFSVPEYDLQPLVFPPFLEMIEYFEQQGFDEVIVSTPGPMGLVALGAAKLLGLSVKGIYHTDFPKYIQQWTEDHNMEDMTWKFMRWFYGDMAKIYVPSRYYKTQLADNGFDYRKLEILPRGVDLQLFSPERRNDSLWPSYGLNGGFKFLYVGRVSKEKNLETLLQAFEGFSKDHAGADLVMVGDGPALKELSKKYKRANIAFTGFLSGEKLAEAYASSDVFVFPSMTDTFGNAILEAHACGLPAIVADQGGPPEIVTSHRSGVIVDASRPENIRAAMEELFGDDETLRALRAGALEKAKESRWEAVLAKLQ